MLADLEDCLTEREKQESDLCVWESGEFRFSVSKGYVSWEMWDEPC